MKGCLGDRQSPTSCIHTAGVCVARCRRGWWPLCATSTTNKLNGWEENRRERGFVRWEGLYRPLGKDHLPRHICRPVCDCMWLWETDTPVNACLGKLHLNQCRCRLQVRLAVHLSLQLVTTFAGFHRFFCAQRIVAAQHRIANNLSSKYSRTTPEAAGLRYCRETSVW